MSQVYLVPWWIVYERCADCIETECLTCRSDRHLTLRAVQAQDAPPNALIGPCDSPAQALARLGPLFRIDENGQMYFHVEVK